MGERELPLIKESSGNLFRKACSAAGIAKIGPWDPRAGGDPNRGGRRNNREI